MGGPKQKIRLIELAEKKVLTENDLMVVHQIIMFAKQKSFTIIDVEKRIFFSGLSDQQLVSFLIFDIY